MPHANRLIFICGIILYIICECKGTEKFTDVQIFQLKVYSLRFKGKEIVSGIWEDR